MDFILHGTFKYVYEETNLFGFYAQVGKVFHPFFSASRFLIL